MKLKIVCHLICIVLLCTSVSALAKEKTNIDVESLKKESINALEKKEQQKNMIPKKKQAPNNNQTTGLSLFIEFTVAYHNITAK